MKKLNNYLYSVLLNFKYYNPVKIEFGCGKLDLLHRFVGNKKTLVISQSIFKELGYVDKVLSQIKNVSLIIDDIKANPALNDLRQQYRKVWKNDFDLIVALGGGSVIDSAKVFSTFGQNRDFCFVEKLINGQIEKKDYELVPIVSIPTTAGTGSEVTPWATVWDTEKRKKYSLHLPNLWSQIAIVDPQITLSMPKNLTIQTGLDALSHSLESIWNKNANPISTKYAIVAAKLILKTLPKLADDLFNLQLREQMMFASLNAGLAFSNTQTAIAHAMSYYISAQKNIPHGLACSFSLPDIIDSVIGQEKRIDNALKEIFGLLSSRPLREMFSKLNISTQIKDYGFAQSDLTDFKYSMMNNQRIGNSLIDNEKLFAKLF